MKFLIIRFSSIGDIVLTTPAIRCLKKQVPGAEVHFLVKESFKTVIEENPYIDKTHLYKNDFNKIAEELKAEKFDYIIDLHKNLRTYKLRFYLRKPKWLSYKKLSVQKFLLTQLGINLMPARNISLRSVDALIPLGVRDDGLGLDYFISKNILIKNEDLPAGHWFGYIAVVIGATWFTKKLPVHKLQQLCMEIDYPIVLVGGKEDFGEGEEIASVHPVRIYNACGKFSLNESAALIQKASLVISHDTGMQYIASAYKKPVLAIWGGTSPKLAVEPFYGSSNQPLHTNFIVPRLPCQPCSNYGTATCPMGHFKCMEKQDVHAIAQKAMSIANKKNSN